MAQEQEIVGFQMREGSNASHISRSLMDEKQEAVMTPTPPGTKQTTLLDQNHTDTDHR